MRKYCSLPTAALVLLLFASADALSQDFVPVCAYSHFGSTGRGGFQKLTFDPGITRGGRWIPTATGEHAFKVLVVFMRFPSDTERTTTWSDPNSLPVDFVNIVSPSSLDTSSYSGVRITNYYWTNSFHKMRVVGDVKYITLNHNEEYYSGLSVTKAICRGNIIREVLIELDSTVNFKDYDNWDNHTEFTQVYQPDGVVDNIWFILRNFRTPGGDTGITVRGTRANIELANGSNWLTRFTTQDTVDIFAGAMDQTDSLRGGIQLIGSYAKMPVTMKDHNGPTVYGTVAHELTHPIFGPNHIVDDYSNHYYNGAFIHESMTGYAVNSGNGFGSHLGYEK